MAVRWDAVVETGSRRWEPPRVEAVRATTCASEKLSVDVWLFGSLAGALPERPFRLQLPAPFAVADVVAELGRQCGGEFASKVSAGDGRLLRHCRVFVNGEAVEDPAAPVYAGESAVQIEMILLTAAEGG